MMSQVEKIQNQIEGLQKQVYQLEDQLNTETEKVFDKYLKDCFNVPGPYTFSIKGYRGESFQVYQHGIDVETGEKVKKDIFTLYYEGKKYGMLTSKNVVKINYYTCGSHCDMFELNRMMVLGKVAEVLNNQFHQINGEMGSELKKVHELFDKKMKPLKAKISSLELEKRELINLERENRKKARLEDFKKGVEFNSYKVIENTNNKYVVTGFKITGFTPSRKTVMFDYNHRGFKGSGKILTKDIEGLLLIDDYIVAS